MNKLSKGVIHQLTRVWPNYYDYGTAFAHTP